MSAVAVYSYTHSVVYVADNMLKSLKDIILLSGLDPANLVNDWQSYIRAIRTWLDSEHLQRVVLEIFNPDTDALITRWDVDVIYTWSSGDGRFWTDTEQLRHHLKKSGVIASKAAYRLLLDTKDGRPHVDGWEFTMYRSTAGLVRQSLGSTIEHNGLGANAAYWRKL